jgi:hypothetical protein
MIRVRLLLLPFLIDSSIVQALCVAKADINAQNQNDGHTALFHAVTPEIVTALIAARADPSIKNNNGQIPIEM